MMMKASLLAVTLFAVGCTSMDDDIGDAEGDRFISGDGKSDTGGIDEGTPQAAGVLKVANTLTEAQLKSEAGLSSSAAANVAAYRKGDDEAAGTADDETFESLRELDSIPFVGPVAFGKLLAYADAHGLTTGSTPPPATSDDPFDPNACSGAAMSQAAAKARWQANQANLGSYQISIRRRGCPNGVCGDWSPVDLGTISWRTKADGQLLLGNYNGAMKLQMKHGECGQYGAYISPIPTYIDGAVCDGVGHTLYCGTYGYPGSCSNGYSSAVEPYELPNGHSFAMEGKLTENCAQLRKTTTTQYGNEFEVGILVRF